MGAGHLVPAFPGASHPSCNRLASTNAMLYGSDPSTTCRSERLLSHTDRPCANKQKERRQVTFLGRFAFCLAGFRHHFVPLDDSTDIHGCFPRCTGPGPYRRYFSCTRDRSWLWCSRAGSEQRCIPRLRLSHEMPARIDPVSRPFVRSTTASETQTLLR